MPTFPIYNQPTYLRMQDFLGNSASYGGLIKSSRFAVQIVPSGITSFLTSSGYSSFMGQFTYLCESAEFPGRGFNMADMRYYGPSFKVPYQADYQETSMTFLCRSESLERQFFDDWMEIINPTDTYDFSYKDNYKCQINMFQFADYGRSNTIVDPNRESSIPPQTTTEFTEPVATYVWTLHDAWPVLVNPQPVTWADDNFQRLSISFSYSKWTRPIKDKQPGTFRLVKERMITTTTPGSGSDGGGFSGGGSGGGGGGGF
jgi:uncharacterized membrane protein YgcG